MHPTIKIFPDNPAVAEAFATEFVGILQRLTESQTKVAVSLSGGSTPKLLFTVLSDKFKTAVDWHKVHFYWGDERCVPPTDDESNFGEADRLFLSKIDIPDANVHRVRGEADPAEERVRYGRLIAETVEQNSGGVPSFDIMLLGMGSDGHTASIFPSEIHLLNSDQICEIATHPQTAQKRITVTGSVINASKHVFFLVTGSGKSEVLAEILNKTGNFKSYPTAHISPASGLTFYIDQAAAANLEPRSAL